jgi:hypothetical protein
MSAAEWDSKEEKENTTAQHQKQKSQTYDGTMSAMGRKPTVQHTKTSQTYDGTMSAVKKKKNPRPTTEQ